MNFQVNDGQTLTRSALKLANDELELMPFPTIIYWFMEGGRAMYAKKLKQQAIDSSKKIRSIWGWPASIVHPVTFADSGISTYEDLKGRRIFTGPPSGAFAVNTEAMIKAVTGFEPNKDYKAIRLNWGSGLQAMLDGKLDVFFRGTFIGGALIDQIGVKKQFRLLNLGDAANSDAVKKFFSRPGRGQFTIPAGTYSAQVNNKEDVITNATLFQMAVRQNMPDDLVYNLTKSTWENIDEVHRTAEGLKAIQKDKPFTGVNMPLHKAAVKYYREAGVQIPDRLIPPEAK